MSEMAKSTLDPSIIKQARMAARAYPELKIRCPWCNEGMLGALYEEHAKTHEKEGRMDAIILAGGKGSRLAPWPAPKCLLPVNGVPILIRLLDHLLLSNAAYVDRAIICVGYRSTDIAMAIDRSRYGGTEFDRTIKLSDAGEDASMATRLQHAKSLMRSERALIVYGDELADVDVGALVKQHAADAAQMTFTYAKQRIPGGVVVDGSVSEKTKVNINIGFVVAEAACWDSLVGVDGVSEWINRCGARPYYHGGKRATVNSLADLAHAEEVWR